MAYVIVEATTKKIGQDIDKILKDHGNEIHHAINEAAQSGYALAEKVITSEVKFPAGYLTSGKKLRLRTAKNPGDHAIISARKRPTSLANFVQGNPGFGQRGGLTTQVIRTRHLKYAFLMRFRSGNKGAMNNVGVMIRKNRYDEMASRRKGPTGAIARMMGIVGTGAAEAGKTEWNGLVPLCGPSVDQVFNSNKDDIALTIEQDLIKKIEKIVTGS